MKKFLGFFAATVALLAVMMSAGGVKIPASAGAAPMYFPATPCVGVLSEDRSAEVVRERLSLSVPALPQGYMTEEAFGAYSASFTAEYEFRNPTSEPLSLRLLFPFGARPEYLMRYDENGRPAGYFDDVDRYGVTVNGEAVAARMRYTYFPYGSEFTRAELDKLFPEKTADDFYTDDLKCHTHVFDVTTENAEERLLELTLSYNPARTRLVFDAERAIRESGYLVVHFRLENAPMLLCAGDDAKIVRARVVERDGYWDASARKEAEAEIAEHPGETTFGEYVASRRPAEVGEADWFQVAADYFRHRTNYEGYFVDSLTGDGPLVGDGELLRWYDYTLEIPAGGTAASAVSGPLYPGVWGGCAHYECLLTPAREWASFGELAVTVETDLTLSDCSLDLLKTDAGYEYSHDGLPLSELELEIDGGEAYDWRPTESIFARVVPVLLGLGAVAFVIVVAVIVIRALKRR